MALLYLNGSFKISADAIHVHDGALFSTEKGMRNAFICGNMHGTGDHDGLHKSDTGRPAAHDLTHLRNVKVDLIKLKSSLGDPRG